VAAVTVAALLAAACSSDGSVTATATTAPGVAGAPSATTVPARDPGGANQPGDPAPTDDAGRPVTTAAGGGSATTAPGPPSVDANVDVGQLAPYILRPGQSTRIVVEVSAQDGAEPAAGTVAHVTSVLKAASGKAVSVDGPARLSGGSGSWTAAQLRQLADSVARTAQGAGGAAVLRLLYLHGDFDGDDHVLGIAVRGDVAAVFVDQVEASSDILAGPDVLEDAVTTHEVGHLLGLVDLVLNTGRDDPEHPGHSRNSGSVMYWAVESSLVTDLLTGGPPRDFDAQDKADLATIRRG
jgi:hypothetical protein